MTSAEDQKIIEKRKSRKNGGEYIRNAFVIAYCCNLTFKTQKIKKAEKAEKNIQNRKKQRNIGDFSSSLNAKNEKSRFKFVKTNRDFFAFKGEFFRIGKSAFLEL